VKKRASDNSTTVSKGKNAMFIFLDAGDVHRTFRLTAGVAKTAFQRSISELTAQPAFA
jgi:hypothetical protein